MSAPIKLTVVLTHPIQYYAPWFRHIQTHVPDIELTVVHATSPTPEQQGVGFERPFAWDVPLTDGYRSIVVRPPRPDDRIDTGHFMGLDVPEIGRAIADTVPDVVLIAGWYSITLIRALLACRTLGVPALCRLDSHLHSAPLGRWRPFSNLKTRMLLRQFAGFLSPGVRTTEYLQWFRVPDHKIFRVPHAVDNAMFAASAAPFQQPAARAAARRRWGIDADAFVPLFVGKLMSSKRPVHAVRAAAALGAGTTLVIAGSGLLEDEVRAEAARLGADVRMTGFMNQSQLGEVYGIADCLVLPSAYPETWGLVVNEALATGLPCVVSDAAGCAPDMVSDDETGYVFALDDIDALVSGMARIRDRKARGHDWGPACRAFVRHYSFQAMTEGLTRACRSVLPHSRRPEPASSDAPPRIVACCGGMVIAGGLERMTFEVLAAVRSGGGATHAIVNGWENFRITLLAEDSGASWSVGPYWFPLTRRRLTPAAVAKMAIEVLRVSRDLLRVSGRIRPTHIFVPDFEAVLRNAPALFWLRARGVRVIMRLGNAPSPGRFYERIWRHLVDRFVDRFVVNSDFTRREVVAVGISGDKVRTIANMPARRRTTSNADAVRIPGRLIFVGQIIPEKGLDLLLDAIALVRGAGIDATLDVVGDLDAWESPTYCGHRAMIRERAASADLAGAVNFLGWREDVPALMRCSSLHCCPSRPEQRESFGNVVLEAKVSGLPSVVTPSGSLPEIVAHLRDGWVCAETTAEALAEGIGYFLSRPDELARAGRAALASASEYSEGRFDSAWRRVFSASENG